MNQSNPSPVLVQTDGPITKISLNRPDVLNAMDASLLEALLGAVESATSDRSCRVIILTGEGRAFCSGGDISFGLENVNGPGPLASQIGRLRRFMRVSQLLHESDAITIAAINGACAGAGMSIACACDLRIASVDAKFNSAFQLAGVPGDFGITWFLPRLVGPTRARRLLFDPTKHTASEVLNYGLVDEVVPADQVMPAAYALAERLLTRAPISLQSVKRDLVESVGLGLSDHLDREAEPHARACQSADAKEAAAAFFDKRAPNFNRADRN